MSVRVRRVRRVRSREAGIKPSGSLDPNRALRGGDGSVCSTGDTSGVVLERLVPARRGRKPGP